MRSSQGANPFRTGQRDLAKGVFHAARLGRWLLPQSPTGIGKTIATLFPFLKACADQEFDKIFFLTAKGSGQALALNALETIRRREPEMALRVLELVARDKSCEHPDKAADAGLVQVKGRHITLPDPRRLAALAAAR